MEESILFKCKGSHIRLLLVLLCVKGSWITVEGQDPVGSASVSEEISETDNELIVELEESLEASWKKQKRIIESFTFLSVEDEQAVMSSTSLEDLISRINNTSSPLYDVLDFLNPAALSGSGINLKYTTAFGSNDRSKLRMSLSRGSSSISLYQNGVKTGSEFASIAYPGFYHRGKSAELRAGFLRIRCASGLLAGPTRAPVRGMAAIRANGRQRLNVTQVSPGSANNTIAGVGAQGSSGSVAWALAVGNDNYQEKARLMFLGTIIEKENFSLGGYTLMAFFRERHEISTSVSGRAGGKNGGLTFEVSRDQSGRTATAVGAAFKRDDFRLGAYFRKFTPGYRARYSNPMVKWSSREKNETGIFITAEFRKKWLSLTLYSDQYWKNKYFLSGTNGLDNGITLRLKADNITLEPAIDFSRFQTVDGPAYLFWSNTQKGYRRTIKVALRWRALENCELRLKGTQKIKLSGTSSLESNSMVLQALINLRSVRLTISAGRIFTGDNLMTTTLYGFNLYGESPWIFLKNPGTVLGIKAGYRNSYGGRIDIKYTMNFPVTGESVNAPAQISLQYSIKTQRK